MPSIGIVIRLFGSLCAVFVLSQFYRSAIAVIAPGLRAEANLSAETLGLLTGAFFFAIAAMQLPVGVMLDRYGPRRTVPSLLAFTVVGSVVFAISESTPGLILGQILIGGGCAGVFMGGLVTISRWFPADRFGTVSAVALAISGLGTLLSATPFAAFTEALGWRGAYLALAAVTAVLAALVFAMVRDAPPGHPYHERQHETLGDAIRGIRTVLAHPPIYGILAVAFVGYAANISVRGLWGGPYLADVHDLGTIDIGNVLLAMSLAAIVGVLVFGPLDRIFRTRKRLILTGMGLAVLALGGLALSPGAALWQVVVWLCLLGAATAFSMHMFAHGRAFFPDHMVGRVMTTINFANFTGVGLIQVATGFLIGAVPGDGAAAPEAAYRMVFGFLGILLLIAMAFYLRTPDAPPGEGLADRDAAD
jgi:MFS family permease